MFKICFIYIYMCVFTCLLFVYCIFTICLLCYAFTAGISDFVKFHFSSWPLGSPFLSSGCCRQWFIHGGVQKWYDHIDNCPPKRCHRCGNSMKNHHECRIFKQVIEEFIGFPLIWVNYNNLTVLPKPGIMVKKGNHPQMALFRLVKYYDLPRLIHYFPL